MKKIKELNTIFKMNKNVKWCFSDIGDIVSRKLMKTEWECVFATIEIAHMENKIRIAINAAR